MVLSAVERIRRSKKRPGPRPGKVTQVHHRWSADLVGADALKPAGYGWAAPRHLARVLAPARAAGLVEVLAAFLAVGGNKAEAARALHLARPTFYERLRRIERICGADLSSAELRTSLHVELPALNDPGCRKVAAQLGTIAAPE